MKKPPPEPIDPEIERKCERVLAVTFRGIHHCHPWWDKRIAWGNGIRVTTRRDLATFDGDELTRLVVAAHDECVRVEVSGAAPGYVYVTLHPRKGREGGSWSRHPDIWPGVENARGIPE